MNKDKLITKMHEKFNLKEDDVNNIAKCLYNNNVSYTLLDVDNMIENLLQAELFVGDTFKPDGYEYSDSNYTKEREALIDAYETFSFINKAVDVEEEIFKLLLNRVQSIEISDK